MDREPGLNPKVPSSARIYDYMLGGKDNYEVDREVARRMLAIAPDTKALAWFIRQFLVQAVGSAAKAGVKQFIDLGAGIPTSPNVHEVARKIEPSARVVYIDNDPVVRAHCDALLANSPGLAVVQADIRSPHEIIDRLKTDSLIDFSEPVAVLIIGVLHYVMDEENPGGILAAFRDAMAPGSYLALTHGSNETNPDFISQSQSDTDNTPSQVRYRSAAEVEELMAGFELLGPGVAPAQEFLDAELPATRLVIYGGLGRKSAD
ncbi:SAM-dependent methyltransferase [Nocardia brasiliensis]|uniref:SAM-dependent methyltransferase n=1 Tax=Nocardia brasiliensis TaxID=37326 RepID=A0A6G9XX68_NOCBR|nr:SAM-dependent methyltransferase [Nocardia brasiliensis]QIS05504.1 SAM-dependent methyltransferase [Nocardia brasiliensis]